MGFAIRVFLSAAACCVAVFSSAAGADSTYPSRPVRLVVGFGPGSTADVGARIVAPKLGEILGTSIVVEDRPGAGSMISTEYVARQPADGYTLLLGTIAATINSTLSPNHAVDLQKDLSPVSLVASIPNILVVHPSLGVHTVKDLVSLAKREPNKISYGSAGVGSAPHLSGELFKQIAGIEMTHVPYQGSAQAVTDLIAGRVQVMFSPASSVLSFIRAGKLVALASTESSRTSAAPDLPTMEEAGVPGFQTGVWFGVLAPKGTPPETVAKLNQAINLTLKDAKVQNLLHVQGMDTLGGSPEAVSKYIAAETGKWRKVITTAHISK